MVRIGDSPPRPDGWAKVTGGAKYTDDLTLPGMLFGATLRSPHPHARIVSLRFDPARAPEGAVAVTAKDVPGVNGVQLIDDTWPVLAEDVVRYVGDAVALVAAPTREAARRALEAFDVEYEPLPPVLTWEDAEREPPLNALSLDHGDLARGFAEADHVIEGVYFCGYQEHIYIECQAMLAWFTADGTLEVMGSMQCPYYVHHAMVHAFGLPEDKVRVRPAVVGGGFGGKEDYPSILAAHAGLLAKASGRPVKIVYDRHEDIMVTSKRHPGRVRIRTGVKADGRLTAMEIHADLDGGAYRTLSPVVLSRAVLHATGAYRCANVKIRGRALRTNTPPNGAFRGFGVPQTMYAAERHMDRIGRVLDIDPLTLRLANAVGPGDTLATGQVLKDDASARLCLERVEKKTNFRARWHEYEKARVARQGRRAAARHRLEPLLSRRRLHRAGRAQDAFAGHGAAHRRRAHRGAHRRDRHRPGLAGLAHVDRRGGGGSDSRRHRVRARRHIAGARLRSHRGLAHDDGGGGNDRPRGHAASRPRPALGAGAARRRSSRRRGRSVRLARIARRVPRPGRAMPGREGADRDHRASRAAGLAGLRREDLSRVGLRDLRLGRGRGGSGTRPRHVRGEAGSAPPWSAKWGA